MIKESIKESMKTYWKNMRYLVTVLGILFITLLISSSIFARGTMETVGAVAAGISEYIQSNNLSFASIGPAVEKGGSFFGALGKVLENYAGLTGTVISGVGAGIIGIIGAAIAFTAVFIIGLFISHDVVFILARYCREQRGVMETWFEIFVKNVLIIVNILVIFYFLSVPFLQAIGFVLLVLFPATYCFLSLLGVWLAAGRERPPFINVITAKNVLVLFLEDIAAIAISLAIGALIFLFMGALVGIFVGLAMLILAAVSISLNAQAFVFGENSWVNYLPDEKTEAITEEKAETAAE